MPQRGVHRRDHRAGRARRGDARGVHALLPGLEGEEAKEEGAQRHVLLAGDDGGGAARGGGGRARRRARADRPGARGVRMRAPPRTPRGHGRRHRGSPELGVLHPEQRHDRYARRGRVPSS